MSALTEQVGLRLRELRIKKKKRQEEGERPADETEEQLLRTWRATGALGVLAFIQRFLENARR